MITYTTNLHNNQTYIIIFSAVQHWTTKQLSPTLQQNSLFLNVSVFVLQQIVNDSNVLITQCLYLSNGKIQLSA